MSPTRRLGLRTERLAELAAEELGAVAGGNSGNTCKCPDYTYYCITGWALCRSRVVC